MVCNSWMWSRYVVEGGIKTLWDKVRIILGKSWPKEQFSWDVHQNKWKERLQGKDYKYSESSSQHYPLACSQDTGVRMRVEVQFSHSVMSDSSHGPQHARPPCPLPTPRVYSNSSPLSHWCHPTISSSVVPFSSCLQSFPVSGSFQRSQLFSSGGQSIGVSASTGGGGTQQLREKFRPEKKFHEHIYWVSHKQWSTGKHLTSMD